jgi:hypothetical protein
MLESSDRPVHFAGRGSGRTTDDDSIQITAMSLARRRALAGVRMGETLSVTPGSRRERLTARDGVAGKWCRNGLKRLNPRPEMVWARKPRTYSIWRPAARLTARRRVASCENDKLRNSQAAPPFFETNVDRTPLMREQHESHRERIEPAATPTVSETRFVHQVRGSSGVGEEDFPLFRLATP